MCRLSKQPEERSQFEVLKAQMYAERAAKRDRKPKRARAMPPDEEPAGRHFTGAVPGNTFYRVDAIV